MCGSWSSMSLGSWNRLDTLVSKDIVLLIR